MLEPFGVVGGVDSEYISLENDVVKVMETN